MAPHMIRSALMVRAPWADLLVTGRKRWEMRTCACLKRDLIGVIKVGTGTIIGVVRISDSRGPLTDAELRQAQPEHLVPPAGLPEGTRYRYAWTMEAAHKFEEPIPYAMRPGQQTFVTLDTVTARRVAEQLNVRIGDTNA